MTLNEIIAQIKQLPAPELEQVRDCLRALSKIGDSSVKRKIGLHPEAFPYVSDDFDKPVDESFFLG